MERRRDWGVRVRVVSAIGAGLLLGLGVWLSTATQAADDRSTRRTASSRASDREAPRNLEEKLDEILDNQQTILSRFDAVMEELQIVKIRATMR